jgi:hypothetical protein
MCRPYLAIFRKLFTFRNRRSVLDLKSIHFPCYCISLFTLKYVCFITKFFSFPTLFSFCRIHVFTTFVHIFPLVERMSLVSLSFYVFQFSFLLLHLHLHPIFFVVLIPHFSFSFSSSFLLVSFLICPLACFPSELVW